MLRAFFQFQSQEEQKHISKALEIILLIFMGSSLLLLAGIIIIPELLVRWLTIILAIYSISIPLLILNRRGYTRTASLGLLLGFWMVITGLALTGGGITTYVTFVYVIIVYIAGILLGARVGILTALICILTTLGLVIMGMTGYMPSRVLPYTPLSQWIALTILIIIMVGLQYLAARIIQDAHQQTKLELDERKRAEVALRSSEERYRSLVEQAPDAIFVADSNLHFIDLNTGACELSGYTREEILQMSIPDLILPEEMVTAMQQIQGLKEGENVFAEQRMRRKDETIVPIELSTKRISDGRFQTIIRDITERKNAEQTMLKEKYMNEEMLESLPGIFYLYNQQGNYLRWNKNFERVTGLLPEEIVQMNTLDKIANEHKSLVKERVNQVFTTGQATVEADLVAKDGTRTPYFFNGRLVTVDEQPCLIGMGFDISERKRTEVALRESERRFSDMLTNLEMIAVMTNDKGNITFCNDYLLRLTGWTRQETIGQNWFEMFVPEQEQQQVTELLVDIPVKGVITPHFVNYIKTRSGEHRLVKWTNTTLRDLDGNVIGVAALGDDVTEDNRAKEENRKLLYNLKERVKELTGLHGAARILQQQNTDIPSVLHDLANLLPSAFQYPESTAARLRLGKTVVITSGFVNSPEALRTDFTTIDGLSGSIEVIYTKDYPPEKEGPFLAEERSLINTLGEMLKTSYDRQQAEQQLKTTTEQLRALMVRVSHAREEEGTRIAREIHDELGSALTSLRWGLESVSKTSATSKNQIQPSLFQEKIDEMMNQIDSIINVVRRIASELRPSILDDLGLVEAIEWQAQQFQERTEIVCQCNCLTADIELNQAQSTAVFRVFQEALTNILRHAQATKVEITTEKNEGNFILTIRDNGIGITKSANSGLKSLGILGMRERVSLVGGKIEINGVKGKGTMLIVQIPISD